MPRLYKAGELTAKVFYNIFARLKVEGKEWVPPRGPLIIVCNHLSNADPPMLVGTIPRRLRFMGKQGLFSNPITALFFNGMGVHPVDRSQADITALRWAINMLKQDEAIILFPEGTRSRSGQMNRGKPGVAYVAAKSQALILPVAITGTENIKKFWRIVFPLCRVNVRIGQPFSLPTVEGNLSRDLLGNLTDMIMERISGLLPESYRGYYSPKEAESRR